LIADVYANTLMITDPFTCLNDSQFQTGAFTAKLSVPWLARKPFRMLAGSVGHWHGEGYCLSPGADPLFDVLAAAGEYTPPPAACSVAALQPAGAAAKLARALTRQAEHGDMEQRCELLLSPESMERWGLKSEHAARFVGEQYQSQVVFGSPVLDVAMTPERAAETVELGEVLLRLTHFQVRLLSCSPEVAYHVARGLHHRLPGASKSRVAYGLAVGGFAGGLPQSSRYSPNTTEQIGALTWLQDHGFRTFCLLEDIKSNAAGTLRRIRVDRCEDVWTCGE